MSYIQSDTFDATMLAIDATAKYLAVRAMLTRMAQDIADGRVSVTVANAAFALYGAAPTESMQGYLQCLDCQFAPVARTLTVPVCLN